MDGSLYAGGSRHQKTFSEEQVKISVIVTVYNIDPYLPRCVESILAQDYRDYELILVDDGSTDRSGQICDEFAQRDSRIRVLHKKNGGVTSARKAGAEIACGEYVTVID
ncbi:MAG: glycosyltransferase, partial [Lachnospiraceae bacterium]|nr:glycosyltransferase [Lachnospiraceae bacterium]